MARLSSLVRVSLCAVLANTAVARTATSTVPAHTVVVHDYAQVATTHMRRAVVQLEAIFRSAGIETTVVVERRPPGRIDQPPALDQHSLFVNVIPAVMDDRIAANTAVLGVVPGADTGGRLAYVFASRVEIAAKRRAADYGTLLGTVLAHEIGHVLLGGRAHTASGVMRPLCDSRQVHALSLGRVSFTSAEAAALRSRLPAQ